MLLIVRRFFILLALPFLAGTAYAQGTQEITIWSCRDKDGRTHVTNLKEDTVGKNCKVVQQSRVQVVPAATQSSKGASKPAPTVFPKEDAQARAAAKSRQRDILERELEREQSLLDQARKELAEQEAVRYGDERNYARVLERLQKYKDSVEVHEKNVESLRREMNNLGR
jgi:hypothetical protein